MHISFDGIFSGGECKSDNSFPSSDKLLVHVKIEWIKWPLGKKNKNHILPHILYNPYI
jgi:hypothetical protein